MMAEVKLNAALGRGARYAARGRRRLLGLHSASSGARRPPLYVSLSPPRCWLSRPATSTPSSHAAATAAAWCCLGSGRCSCRHSEPLQHPLAVRDWRDSSGGPPVPPTTVQVSAAQASRTGQQAARQRPPRPGRRRLLLSTASSRPVARGLPCLLAALRLIPAPPPRSCTHRARGMHWLPRVCWFLSLAPQPMMKVTCFGTT